MSTNKNLPDPVAYRVAAQSVDREFKCTKRSLLERDVKRLNRYSRRYLNDPDIVWYCLYVQTGKELMTQNLLGKWARNNRYFKAEDSKTVADTLLLVPLEERVHRVSRYSRRNIRHTYPALPGCLFVGTPGNIQFLYRFLQLHIVHGVLAIRGEPAQIAGDRIACFMRQLKHFKNEKKQETGSDASKQLRPGDHIEIVNGPLRGHSAEISQIDRKVAHILLELLGSTREAAISVKDLQPQSG